MWRAARAVILACLLPAGAEAQWSDLQDLSRGALPSRLRYNWGWAIDVDGAGAVHAVWLEQMSEDPPPWAAGE